MALFGTALLMLVVAGVYLAPALIAYGRGIPAAGSILVIDIFLGWTFLGWVVALAMSVRGQPQPSQVQVFNNVPLPPGPPSWQDPVSHGLIDAPGRPDDDAPASFRPPWDPA